MPYGTSGGIPPYWGQPSAPGGGVPGGGGPGGGGPGGGGPGGGAPGGGGPGARRWPRAIAAGAVVLALAAAAGGTAGYATTHASAVAPAGAPAAPGLAPGADATALVAAAARALPGVVSVQAGRASGSGFVFDDDGHVVTNNHVVAAADGGPVRVTGQDGRSRRADVVGTDPSNDIAVLAVDPDGLEKLERADLRTTHVGEPVLALGSPLGLSGTVTAGIVSALNREVRLGGDVRRTAVQTDASINPGNSGGPLVNARGEVLGVNTAIATLDGNGSIGIGFAIPIDRAAQVATTLIARG
ncbi:S1C family serine protease [Cryptosporangium phraense]|uniref:S1C family serine protease n=1 Tax=Cryptosporangium phraense TaxID=2593070 RepID=UPI00197AB64D|nr:trypsin-like peptidase domain-containing protein [Cryptosporangium phraense]